MKKPNFSLFIYFVLLIQLLSCSFQPLSEEEYNKYNDISIGDIVTADPEETEETEETEVIDDPELTDDPDIDLGTGYSLVVDYILGGESDTLWYASGTDFGKISNGSYESVYNSSTDITGLSWLDSENIIIETSNSLYSIKTTTLETNLLYNSNTTIDSALVSGDYLIVNFSGDREVIQLSNNLITDNDDMVYSASYAVVDQERSRMFYLRRGVSPGDICYQDIDKTDGTLGSEGDSIYHGRYSNVGPLHLYPDGSRIIQGNGYVFDTSDSLKIYSKIPYDIEDLIFYDDDILVITDNSELLRISSEAPYNIIKSIGTYPKIPFAIIPKIGGAYVVTIYKDKTYIDTLNDDDISRPTTYIEPELSSDSNGMKINIPIEKIVSGNDSTFYFSSGTGLFKISNDSVEFLQFLEQNISSLLYENTDSLIIISGTNVYRYLIASNTVKLVHEELTRISTACIAGDYLVFDSDNTYAMDLATTLITDTSSNSYSADSAFVFDPVNNMILGETSGISPKDIEYYIIDTSTGVFTEYKESMYHGDYSFIAPYRFFPDGSKVMSASGEIFTTEDRLPYFDTLPNSNSWVDMFFYNNDMILLTNNKQLIRAGSITPYGVGNVIDTFTFDGKFVILSGSNVAIVTVEDSINPSYRVKIISEADL